MKHVRSFVVLLVAIAMTALIAAGCNEDSQKEQRRVGRGDVPIGTQDLRPAEVLNMPNTFANLATKCDGHGHRIYTTTHSNESDNKVPANIAVIADPGCGS